MEASDTERVLATVLFTDIVDSTVQAASLGDQAWRAVLDDQRRHSEPPIGQTFSTFVKRGDPRKNGKSSETVSVVRDFVKELYVANKTRNEDQIDRAVAHNLVGNGQVATAHIVSSREFSSSHEYIR
jgi:hypothetical protein